ncbi:MAG: hypothetical protein VCD00_01875 [Candidatus Hydrogenedentota bacterium]
MRYLTLYLFLLCVTTHAVEPDFSGMSYLDNGEIRVGVNLDIGGAITWLSKSGSDENIVNSHDWGRQIQMSFYSGPIPFEPNGKKPKEHWKFLGWNPIQSGDTYGNPSRVTDHENDGKKIFAECTPMHWPLDNEAAECRFVVIVRLEGNTVQVQSTLFNKRSDKTVYATRGQELPAVYTNGSYYRLFSYDGEEPFEGESLRRITKVWDSSKSPQEMEGGPWDHWYATENWAALVNDDNFGLGIYSPGTYSFVGGFAGKPGSSGPKDAPTGYIAPTRREILDHNLMYRYTYTLIVDTLGGIRNTVYELASDRKPPSYTFLSGLSKRQSWVVEDCEEDWSRNGFWSIYPNGMNPQLIGPDSFWEASEVDAICIRAAFNTGTTIATLQWEGFGDGSGGSVDFPIVSDWRMRDYTVNLKGLEGYEGTCKRLSFSFMTDSGAGRVIVFESIDFE